MLTSRFLTVLAIVVLWTRADVAMAQQVDHCPTEFGSDAYPYRGKDLTQPASAGSPWREPSEELRTILSNHKEWLDKYKDGDRQSYDARQDPLRARLCGAVLTRISLFVSDLSFADLSEVNLEYAFLNGATLRGVNLTGARLRGAQLVGTDVNGATFGNADLAQVRYEPTPGIPHPIAIRRALNLEDLTFREHPDGLIELRTVFRSAGRRDLERRITYAIERSRTLVAWEQGRFVEAAFRWLAWELPTAYDLKPARALRLFVLFWLAFTPIYLLALYSQSPPKMWRVLSRDRIGGDGNEVQEAVVARGVKALSTAAYFSFLSISRVGWRDLSIGTWVSRLQGSEYDLRAVGWVRTIAGLQSLLGFYLLALWALTYFGRLFEG